MTKRILLWLNAFCASVYFTGHLYDYIVITSNWKTGSVEIFTKYRAFFINADPGVFFKIVVPATLLLSILSFFAYLKTDKTIKFLLAFYLILTLGAFLFTMIYFLPINNYLFWSKELNYEPVKTMELAHKWVFGEKLRLAFSIVTLFIAARALHFSYKK